MRRSYDPSYGSREQLKDCHEAGMQLRRELHALKTENAELLEEIKELKAMITYLSKGE
jgi:cell division protein FtsB